MLLPRCASDAHVCVCVCACMHVCTCMWHGGARVWQHHADVAGCRAPTRHAAGARVATAAGWAAAPMAGKQSRTPGGALARISRSLRSGTGRGSGRQPAGARPIRDADSAARLMSSRLEKTAAAPPPPASPRHPAPRWVLRARVQPFCLCPAFWSGEGSGWHRDAVPWVPAGH